MARRINEPITVLTRRQQPTAFTWRGATYRVRVIGSWKLATRWWEAGSTVDRTYFRVQADDQQIFELYREAAAPGGDRWVLDICQD